MQPTNQVLKIYAELRKVKDEMLDYQRQYPNSIFSHLFKQQLQKIEWCYTNVITSNSLCQVALPLVEAIKENWTQEYTLERDAIRDRIEILSTKQLQQFDVLLDYIEQGIEFEINPLNK